MDRQKPLAAFTDQELLEEINRRRTEHLEQARALTLGPFEGKSPRKSQAKLEYWQEWHEYRKQHPNATVDEWRRSKKRKK